MALRANPRRADATRAKAPPVSNIKIDKSSGRLCLQAHEDARKEQSGYDITEVLRESACRKAQRASRSVRVDYNSLHKRGKRM